VFRSGADAFLSGRLDNPGAEACAQRVLPRLGRCEPDLTLDLTGVDYVGGAGLRVLLALDGRAHAVGQRLRIIASPAVRNAAALAGVPGLARLFGG